MIRRSVADLLEGLLPKGTRWQIHRDADPFGGCEVALEVPDGPRVRRTSLLVPYLDLAASSDAEGVFVARLVEAARRLVPTRPVFRIRRRDPRRLRRSPAT